MLCPCPSILLCLCMLNMHCALSEIMFHGICVSVVYSVYVLRVAFNMHMHCISKTVFSHRTEYCMCEDLDFGQCLWSHIRFVSCIYPWSPVSKLLSGFQFPEWFRLVCEYCTTTPFSIYLWLSSNLTWLMIHLGWRHSTAVSVYANSLDTEWIEPNCTIYTVHVL